ncbi:MAG: ATP-binding protein [Rhodospirillaceae bacterium]
MPDAQESSSQSSPQTRESECGIGAAVSQAQVRLVYAQVPVSQGVTLVNGAVLAYVQSGVVGATRPLAWLACLCAVAAARTYISALYTRASAGQGGTRRWHTYFLAGSLASGMMWGAAALFLYPAASLPHEVFLAFVLAGMVAGSMTVLAPVYTAFLLFAACALLPLTARYLAVGDPLHTAMGFMAGVFLVAMLIVGRSIHSTIRESFRLRFENEELIKALRRSNEALESRVMERTAALQEQDRRKDEFLATLAHELRNPLAPLASSVEILKLMTEDAKTVTRVVEVMERQIRQMMHLIDDLLDVNRITRGKVALRRMSVDVACAIEHAVEGCRPLLGERRITITAADSHPLCVYGDAVRLEQVFGNLLNNACKFTGAHGHISIGMRREGDDVVVAVSDDGIGIPSDKLQTVFEMFSQLDAASERAAGLGLGLALVKQLVDLHGGTVTAHSPGLGHGATFTVRLPAIQAEPEAPRVEQPPASASRRILVVDDNRDAAESLATLLELTGHKTERAYDGQEVVEKALAFRPEVILLDLGMAGMSGYDACRALRADPLACDAIIVALTGWGQDVDRLKCDEAGFDGYLVKPVTREALTALLASGGSSRKPVAIPR